MPVWAKGGLHPVNKIFAALLDLEEPEEEEPSDPFDAWVEEAAATWIVARAYADVASWLRDAKGPNADFFKEAGRGMNRAALLHLRALGQKAFLLWGVNVPLPKGLKEE